MLYRETFVAIWNLLRTKHSFDVRHPWNAQCNAESIKRRLPTSPADLDMLPAANPPIVSSAAVATLFRTAVRLGLGHSSCPKRVQVAARCSPPYPRGLNTTWVMTSSVSPCSAACVCPCPPLPACVAAVGSSTSWATTAPPAPQQGSSCAALSQWKGSSPKSAAKREGGLQQTSSSAT